MSITAGEFLTGLPAVVKLYKNIDDLPEDWRSYLIGIEYVLAQYIALLEARQTEAEAKYKNLEELSRIELPSVTISEKPPEGLPTGISLTATEIMSVPWLINQSQE